MGTGDPLSLIAFLKEFADKCHHGKEEGILFPALEKAKMANEDGLITLMLQEHVLGRKHIQKMEAALKGSGNLKEFAKEATAYSSLLIRHIEKENTLLFPMGEKALSPSELESIFERFEEHENNVIGAGRHEELHEMLNGFEKKYLK